MQKRIFLLAALIILLFTTSGCMKYSTSIEISKNDEVTLKHTVALDNKIIDTENPNFNERGYSQKDIQNELRNDYISELQEEKKFHINEFNKNSFSGYNIEKKYRKPSNFRAIDLPEGYSILPRGKKLQKYPIVSQSTFFIKKYTISLKFDPSVIKDYDTSTGYVKTKRAYLNSLDTRYLDADYDRDNPPVYWDVLDTKPDMTLAIKIPRKASEHNATSFDDKTHVYTWDLSNNPKFKTGEPIEIILEYKKYDFFSIILVLIVMIATIVGVYKNKDYIPEKSDENLSAFWLALMYN